MADNKEALPVVAWAWKNKQTGAQGVYFEDPPKFFNLEVANIYEWTPLTDRATATAALSELRAEVEQLQDVLRRGGFVRCDVPACNCGSWHARYGLPERMAEIKDILADAGHPVCNENGNLVSNALLGLVADRDTARSAASGESAGASK